MTVIDIRTRLGVEPSAPDNSLQADITEAFGEIQTIQCDLAHQMKALLTLAGHENAGLSRECQSVIGELSKNLAKLSNALP